MASAGDLDFAELINRAKIIVANECKTEVATAKPENVVDDVAQTMPRPIPRGLGRLSANAPAFEPVQSPHKEQNPEQDPDNILPLLPMTSLALLRRYFRLPCGMKQSYYAGKLKSFNVKNGYGFLASSQAKTDWGVDVFIHKNMLPERWMLNQPCEFAVVINDRGQPQAADVQWLPMIAIEGRTRQPGADVMFGASQFALASSPKKTEEPVVLQPIDTPIDTPRMVADPSTSETSTERYFGTLKSFSQNHGYGFIACDEVLSRHKRDVYVSKGQVTKSQLQIGIPVEFAYSLNNKGQPQARELNWDPVPRRSSSTELAEQLTSTEMLNIKKLLRLLRDADKELVVVTAIEYHGTGESANARDVDYLTFVLDRLGSEVEAANKFKDVLKLLMLLMLSKLFKFQAEPKRYHELLRWFHAMANSLNVSSESTKEHIKEVVVQITAYLGEALEANAILKDPRYRTPLIEICNQLQALEARVQPSNFRAVCPEQDRSQKMWRLKQPSVIQESL